MKLKTLKDIKEELDNCSKAVFHFEAFEELKQEAIKWVKERIRKCCGVSEIIPICEEHQFWMEKFNITEEDLK